MIMRNPTEAELSNLEELWSNVLPNYSGIKIASQDPPGPGAGACEQYILSMWSAMPALNKQRAIQLNLPTSVIWTRDS
jgi:hypothetical protein